MKKIYLAGPCDTEHRTLMWQVATLLRNSNKFEVYCPWEFQVPDAWTYTQEDWASFVFSADIQAIADCNIFVMISMGRDSTAGTNWEQGFAWGLGKDVVVVQVTDKPTSLMTYHGCDLFINTNQKNLNDDIDYLIAILDIPTDQWSKLRCSTVLT